MSQQARDNEYQRMKTWLEKNSKSEAHASPLFPDGGAKRGKLGKRGTNKGTSRAHALHLHFFLPPFPGVMRAGDA